MSRMCYAGDVNVIYNIGDHNIMMVNCNVDASIKLCGMLQ